ncbi:MAG: hypothetical protein IJW78_04360 [Clostridia bacterium]|nr:hypothetical protein [Clostridia bacterium]
MKVYRLSKKTLYLWYVYAFLVFGLLCILSLVISYFLPSVSHTIMAFSVLAGLFAVLFYLPALWRSVDIRVSDAALSYTVGFFMRREHILPLDRLLFMQKVCTPVSALFNMHSLRIKALGGYLLLPPLESEIAEEIISRCGRRH